MAYRVHLQEPVLLAMPEGSLGMGIIEVWRWLVVYYTWIKDLWPVWNSNLYFLGRLADPRAEYIPPCYSTVVDHILLPSLYSVYSYSIEGNSEPLL